MNHRISFSCQSNDERGCDLVFFILNISPVVHGGAPVIDLKMAIPEGYASISSTCAILLKYYIAKSYGIMTHTRPSKRYLMQDTIIVNVFYITTSTIYFPSCKANKHQNYNPCGSFEWTFPMSENKHYLICELRLCPHPKRSERQSTSNMGHYCLNSHFYVYVLLCERIFK